MAPYFESFTDDAFCMHSFDLGGPGVYQRGPKFEIKHKSRRLQRVSLLIGGGGGKHVDWKGQAPLAPPYRSLCFLGGPSL